ncbi:SHOCT domain-containing protein [Mycobacterium colombiense]|uniref:SHOCT domain-containing protein n=1 Tax=Mycobacterium colombiense TaxID=339268 RepID=A0A853LX04_9MYCO|nr:SHOCT domain-containing protein [Mycobacterium colombiense]OBJ22948.1 hypothetical protein A5623_08200 [Mycobacterium colombiense]OBJ57243.1 hypothetical protein A5628_17445 [Mycobacterium colombiense]
MKSKVIVLTAGVALSLFLVARYFALSRAGVPLGWMLYLGLPVTGAGVLFALRLLELGDGWRAGPDALRRGESPDGPPAPSERLEQLEMLYARGGISDREYRARRLEIISGG